MPILSCKEIEMAYDGTSALKDISFDIEKGDYLFIIGENGSGKTSLIKGILGLLPLKSGKAEFYCSRNRVGYLPQITTVRPDFPSKVFEIVLSGRLSHHGFFSFYNAKDKRIAKENLERLGAAQLANKHFAELSGGQRQRVLLARALSAAECNEDSILFLDEPQTGLDPIAVEEMYSIIQRLNKDFGLTTVMVSHDIPAALKYSTKILQLNTTVEYFGKSEDYLKSNSSKRFKPEGGKE